jgi:RNA polymerase nonessential primary-like sigma factor
MATSKAQTAQASTPKAATKARATKASVSKASATKNSAAKKSAVNTALDEKRDEKGFESKESEAPMNGSIEPAIDGKNDGKKAVTSARLDKAATKTATKTKKVTKRSAKSLYTTDAVRAYLHEIGRVPLLSHEDEIVLGKQVQQLMALLEIKEQLAGRSPASDSSQTDLDLSDSELEDLDLEASEADDADEAEAIDLEDPALADLAATTNLGKLAPAPEEVEEAVSQADWAKAAGMSEAELSNHLRRGQRAKRQMIEANLRLVVAVAKKYQKRNLEFLDLIQEGTLGLERGVEKFDPMKGYKFSTYAYWWIRQAITRAIAQQARTIRLPIHITEKLNKIKRVQRELSQKLGRSPNAAEIGLELELEPKQVREYLTIARQPISLDVRIGDNQDTELQDLLEDDGASPEDYTVQQSLRQDIFRMLSELTPQQQEVINLRFGLNDGNPLSLAKVGQRMSISRERVRQLEQQALKHLRRRKASINGYLAAS